MSQFRKLEYNSKVKLSETFLGHMNHRTHTSSMFCPVLIGLWTKSQNAQQERSTDDMRHLPSFHSRRACRKKTVSEYISLISWDLKKKISLLISV